MFKANYSGIEYHYSNITSEDKFILPYGHCKNLKISNFNGDWNTRIYFNEHNIFEIYITNPLETTNISISKMSMLQDPIINNGNLGGKFYMIHLIEEHMDEEDCHHYGNDFKSFAHCDEFFSQKTFLSSEIGCIPPWMSSTSHHQYQESTSIVSCMSM